MLNTEFLNHKKKVLIIDDEPNSFYPLRLFFETPDFETEICFDGQVAKQMVQDTRYNLMVVDWLMPELDGFQTLKMLDRQLKTKVPYIIFSGLEPTEIIVPETQNLILLSKICKVDRLSNIVRQLNQAIRG